MKPLFLLSFLVALFFLSSCGRTECITTYYGLAIVFKGYETDTGVRVTVAQRSKNGGAVLIQLDTFVMNSNLLYREIGDSISGRRLEQASPMAYVGYDCQVDLPATGRQYYISGIEFTDDTRKKQFMEGGSWGNQCINVCTGYYVNGTHVATGYTGAVPYGAPTDAYIILRKQ